MTRLRKMMLEELERRNYSEATTCKSSGLGGLRRTYTYFGSAQRPRSCWPYIAVHNHAALTR